jgi:hypothetical protein
MLGFKELEIDVPVAVDEWLRVEWWVVTDEPAEEERECV